MEPLATDDPTHTAKMDIYRILVRGRTKGDDSGSITPGTACHTRDLRSTTTGNGYFSRRNR